MTYLSLTSTGPEDVVTCDASIIHLRSRVVGKSLGRMYVLHRLIHGWPIDKYKSIKGCLRHPRKNLIASALKPGKAKALGGPCECF